MRPKFVLIDANSLVHRAYHALPPLSTSDGVLTNAVYGFAQMLLGVLENEKPDALAVAFDPPGPTFRDEEYEAYKAGRPPTPDDLAAQMPLARQLVESFNIPILEAQGYEADDAIAAAARQAEDRGYDVLIVTGDRDALQLVSDHTHVLATVRGITQTQRFDRAQVESEYGVPPERLVAYKGLAGDASDNIPGVPGIGPKTAARLLARWASVEQVLAHLGDVEQERLRGLLSEHADQARLSERLAQLRRDAPVAVDFEAASVANERPGRARKLMQRLEFTSLLKRLPADGEWSADCTRAADPESLAALCDRIAAAGCVAVAALASPGPDAQPRLEGIALSLAPQTAVFVPAPAFVAREAAGDGLFDADGPAYAGRAADRLRELLADESVPKWGEDLKRSAVILRRHGLALAGLAFDTMVASYTLAPHRSTHSLDDLVLEHLGQSLPPAPGRRKRGEEEPDPQPARDLDAAQYRACAEADAVVRLEERLGDRLAASPAADLFAQVEMPLVPVLAEMELAGIAVDAERLRNLGEQMDGRIAELSEAVFGLAGREFNLDSPKQLGHVLFEELKLPGGKRTKTGYSTSAGVLENLAAEHDIARKILEYRGFAKLKSTYVDGLLRLADATTGRVHTTFNQTVAATGRLSSSDPNLQNIPVRTEWGREIRACFIPGPDGWQLVAADYSQIELRLLAHLTGSENLLAAFRAGEDIHTRTASEVFEVGPDDVTPDMRRRAKTVNFAVIYGMGPRALAQQIEVSEAEAQAFIETYFRKLPEVRRFQEQTLRRARESGGVETIFGRRREMPDLASSNPGIRSYAERAAVNHPIQGSAADIIKIAMVSLARELRQARLQSRLLLQVHDELVLEAPPDEVDRTCELTRRAMAAAAQLAVPLTVDVAVGDNWRDLKPREAGEAARR